MFVHRWFRSLTLAGKLNTIIMVVGAASVALACAVFAIYDATSSGRRVARDLTRLADHVAATSADAVANGDAAAATEAIAAVWMDEDVALATIESSEGHELARFERQRSVGETTSLDEGSIAQIPWKALTASALGVTRPIMHDGRAIGSISIASGPDAARSRALAFLKISGSVLFLTCALGF